MPLNFRKDIITLYRSEIEEKERMNPLLTTQTETFRAGNDNLSYFRDRLIRITDNGAIMFCIKGEANITIDFQEYHIVPHTQIVLLPDSVLSLSSASKDFNVHYFVFSGEMMKIACIHFEPAFIQFLKELICFTHSKVEMINYIQGIIEASVTVYEDKENRFRDNIAQNLLQIFFLNAYDKVRRLFTKEQIEGSTRKGQLFRKFIRLVHLHCASQRDVAFYAEKLCISTRYLSAITQKVTRTSAKEIIDEFLILEIKVTLQTTNLSLKEVAEHFRFPDQSFFGRYFKKHTGMSPKEYRAKLF